MTVGHYCTFRVGPLAVGISVERVQEVLLELPVTFVPQAHPSVLGLLNLRGQIITAIDARTRLGLLESETDQEKTHVIILCDGESMSLVVDAAGDVVEVDNDALEPVPETFESDIRSVLSSVYALDASTLLLMLDADRLLTLAEV